MRHPSRNSRARILLYLGNFDLIHNVILAHHGGSFCFYCSLLFRCSHPLRVATPFCTTILTL